MEKQCNRCHRILLLTSFSRAKTCRDGHRNYCKQCQSVAKKSWYEANKEHVLNKNKYWHQTHPEQTKEHKKRWLETNPNFPKEYHKKYRVEHRKQINAHTAARRKRLQQNTPPWADRGAIVDFYRNCPQGCHVDHIIPLRGRRVSGLHVIENLQYLPAIENMRKGNKEMTEFPT